MDFVKNVGNVEISKKKKSLNFLSVKFYLEAFPCHKHDIYNCIYMIIHKENNLRPCNVKSVEHSQDKAIIKTKKY